MIFCVYSLKACRVNLSECGRGMRDDVLEQEDGEFAQLALTQQIHFCGATNQSALRESESSTCVCSEIAARAHSAGARSK